jgi:molecular chaperone DnaK (HSP70)
VNHTGVYTVECIGIEAHGGRAVALIPAGTLVPVARAMTFTTVADGQRAVEVRVVRCDASGLPSGVVGRFLVNGLRPGRGGTARIDIGVSLDREGVIRAWGVDRHTGWRQEAAFPGLWALDRAARPRVVSRMADRVGAELASRDVEWSATLREEAQRLRTTAVDGASGPFLAAMLGEIANRHRTRVEPTVAV